MQTKAFQTQDPQTPKVKKLIAIKTKVLSGLAEQAGSERKSINLLINEILERHVKNECRA